MNTCPHCAKTRSSSGNPFNEQSLKQHINDAHVNSSSNQDATAYVTASHVWPDAPDGAFWALYEELGGTMPPSFDPEDIEADMQTIITAEKNRCP